MISRPIPGEKEPDSGFRATDRKTYFRTFYQVIKIV
jgi:hypothetical protein